MPATVSTISYAPVKGLALREAQEVVLESSGIRDNRRLYLVADDGRLVNGKVAGPLVQVHASTDPDVTSLVLRFPDGSALEGELELGAAVETSFFGRAVAGHLVEGQWSQALSAFAGRLLRLVRADEPGAGSDRGPDGSVSLVSGATLDRLAREAGADTVDGRRFRMLFGLDGLEANAEDAWVGHRVAVGDAVVRLHALVGRCAVTTHDPDTGVPDLDVLRLLAAYRSDVESEEPLPLGVWGAVESPGRVRVGDAVEPL